MSDHYILEDREIKKVDLGTWARWLEEEPARKVVKQEDVGDFWVSTVFLGLDHSFGDGPPVLFETMVFRRKSDGEIDFGEVWGKRSCTYSEAEAVHRLGVAFSRGEEVD